MWHNDANVNVYEDIGNKITALPFSDEAGRVNLKLNHDRNFRKTLAKINSG